MTEKRILEACARFLAKRLSPITENMLALEGRMDAFVQKEVTADQVVAKLLESKSLEPILDLYAAEAVQKHLQENPIKGEKGEPGVKGDAGADGIGLAGAVISREGSLIITKSNGETIDLGPVIGKDGEDGKPGQDGKDGVGFDDLSFEYDGERGISLKFVKGEQAKEFKVSIPMVLYKGYWRTGMSAEQGDAYTENGSLWIANKATDKKPCYENREDWTMATRKGRDGYDAGQAPTKSTVSLKHGV